MAKSAKDAKGWEIILGEKAASRHMRQLSKGSGITLKRLADGLTFKEGDCISFNLNRDSEYKIKGYGFIKDIYFAVDKYIAVRILWFVQYAEKFNDDLQPLPNNEKYLSNDLFLSPFLDSINFNQILTKITVLSEKQIKENKSKDDNIFICRRFADDSSTYFTDIIDWDTILESFRENKDEFYHSLKLLTMKPKSGRKSASQTPIKPKPTAISFSPSPTKRKGKTQVKTPNKKKIEDESSSDNASSIEDFIISDSDDDALDEVYDSEDDTYTPATKRVKSRSPKKRKYTISDKKSPRKRSRKIDVPELPVVDNDLPFLDDEEYSTARMLVKAKKVLGTGTALKALPCREEEFYELYHRLEDSINSKRGCCIYVSGTPGVGKTATIREVIKQLSAKMTIQSKGVKVFNYVEINGLKLIKPQAAYEVLWKKISKNSTSANNALNFLQQHFETTEEEEKTDDEYSNKLPLVVLLDELDQIVTKNQAVMYNFFNWPTYENSRLIVIAVANTMDLPERLLTNKISSRLGLSRIQFISYSYNQLSEIIKHRLEQLSKQNDKLLIAKDAIEFASRKVASVSGDARRSLMICIRAVEIAEAEFMNKSESERKELDGKYTVTIMHIMKAVNETSSSPVTGYLNSLTFLSKLVLACIMLKKKRLGIAEIQVGDVYDELSNQIQVLLFSDLKSKLSNENLNLLDIVFGDGNKHMSGSVINASSFILKDLEESGILMMQPLKLERNRLIRLNISDDEILNCFKKDPFMKEIITFI